MEPFCFSVISFIQIPNRHGTHYSIWTIEFLWHVGVVKTTCHTQLWKMDENSSMIVHNSFACVCNNRYPHTQQLPRMSPQTHHVIGYSRWCRSLIYRFYHKMSTLRLWTGSVKPLFTRIRHVIIYDGICSTWNCITILLKLYFSIRGN